MMIRVAWFILLTVILSGCGKASNQVPDVAVNFSTLLTDPRLTNINQGVLISGYGVAGLILYRSSVSGIVAYDRCSTVNPENKCALVLNGDYTATDPCSGAKFLLEDGSPAKAPATISLKQYNVSVSENTIRVTN